MCVDGFVYNNVTEVRGGTCTNLRAANIVAYVTAAKLRHGGVNKVSLWDTNICDLEAR